ncbi:MAG TPA: hypothetical protein VKD21_06910 [Acidimicrobiales bacterium]|nr:hypothetical protein [Acidimicrobiales bacterium]
MGMPGNAGVGRVREHGARALVVLAVALVVAIVAAGLVAAGVDRVEVVATLLFVPVFAAGLIVGRSAGWLAAAVAAVVYLALRSADVDDAGMASIGVLALTRAAAYAVAAEVGLRAQPIVDRLLQGNEWDDSPLVARGRAFSKRERAGDDAFGAGRPTSVWVTTPDDEDGYPAPTDAEPAAWPEPVAADARAAGSEWSEPLGSLAPDYAPDAGRAASPTGVNGWPPDPPAASPPPWSDPYGSPAVPEPAGEWAPPPQFPTPSPAPWSDPYGSPAVAAEDPRWQPGSWYDAVPPPPSPPAPSRPAPPAPSRPAPPRRSAAAASSPAAPPIDPETRLWTARFLCDRIAAEKAHCERTGNPFSLVLVQVPDEPFALLPYRRQVTILRELGHQFVAGGVLDHLVHVPDRTQHWFAVVLPDVDRSDAQVLERRLRTGIGGYLRSRGLPLAELESASLTSPDDDPALGAIWDALAARGDPGSAGDDRALAYGY